MSNDRQLLNIHEGEPNYEQPHWEYRSEFAEKGRGQWIGSGLFMFN